ncbi:serine/threonine protein kinase, partial [Leptolyngbya sp. FACHB-36]|uniref:serine/threonine-protein kinase n=1 Tax=Leptolyngbya sp. FACHB-36 TaxID=2692808 RepID=UPI0016808AE6
MSYCLNPYCSRPQNPDAANFCTACGFRLRLGDRYRPLNRIGRGGFGRTFLAVDEYKPSRPLCVIKQFFPQNPSQQDPELATVLFRREAMQLEQLGSHPQIPELLAHFEQAGYHYLVQEFIDGQNLVQEVTERGAFTEQQIWHLLDDLLPVLEFIHHHHVIHRDIKPQNIIRRASTGQYVLVDFGAAKTLEGTALERTGTSIGSAEFTPPEQAIGKATFASDLYSLGVTCIYLLTHVRPAELFDTEEGTWVWQRHLDRPMSGVLASLLDKLLQGPTKRRYQSVEAVLEDLHAPEIVTGLGVVAGERGERGVVQAASVKPELPETMLPEEERSLNWRCQHTLTGHQSWVRSVVFQSNGALLASGSGDRTVKLWNLEGELHRTIAAHAGWVRAITTSPNGELLASCSNDRTVKVWQWQTGELVQTLNGHTDWVRSVMFSPEGKHLISGSQDGTVRIWYVATGKLLQTLRGHEHWVTSIAVAP